MNRFEKTIRSLMMSLVRQCEHENHFRTNDMPEKIHDCISKIAILQNVLTQADFYVTFDTDDKLNYTKVHFKDMKEHVTITFDILSTKERLNAMYGKIYNGGYVDTDSLSCIQETDDGYDL